LALACITGALCTGAACVSPSSAAGRPAFGVLRVLRQQIPILLSGRRVVAAPGLGDAGSLLDRHALPARGEGAVEAGGSVLVGQGLGAKGGRVLLAQPEIVRSEGIERRNLGVVGLTEVARRDGTRQAHQFPFPSSPPPGLPVIASACGRGGSQKR
jgi:hypothetical protein